MGRTEPPSITIVNRLFSVCYDKRVFFNGLFCLIDALKALIMVKKVDIIPAGLRAIGRDKVGIYCRVSPSSSAQLHSLASQAARKPISAFSLSKTTSRTISQKHSTNSSWRGTKPNRDLIRFSLPTT